MSGTYNVTVGRLDLELPIVPVSETTSIAFIQLLGENELIRTVCSEFAERISQDAEVILGPETVGIVIAHQLSEMTGLPYVIARKKKRPNMANVESIAVHTIGTSFGQSFFISDYERSRIRGKKVAIVDEVVSTGATISALRDFVSICGGAVEDVLCIATEGQYRADVKALIHLPIFSAS